MFYSPSEKEMEFVSKIFQQKHFQSNIGAKQRLQGHPVADPFVIASAYCRNGCVITEETKPPNAARIPNICEYFSVRWSNVEGFLLEKGWRF